MADRIQQRRDTKARWAQYNPTLLEGEVGYELDTQQYKVGDGVHAWNDLPYRGDPCLDQMGDSQVTPMSQSATSREIAINRGNSVNGTGWRKQTGAISRTYWGDGWSSLTAEQLETYARAIVRAEIIGDALPDKDYYIWIWTGPNYSGSVGPKRMTVSYDDDQGTSVEVFSGNITNATKDKPVVLGSTTGAQLYLWVNWDVLKDMPDAAIINGNSGGNKLLFNKPYICYDTLADSPWGQEQEILKNIGHNAVITNRLYLKDTDKLDSLSDDEKLIFKAIRSIRLVNNPNNAGVGEGRGAFISSIKQSKSTNSWEIRINYGDNQSYVLNQTGLTEQPKNGMVYYPAGSNPSTDSAGVILDMDWSLLPDEFTYSRNNLTNGVPLSFDGNNIFNVSSILGDDYYIPNSQFFIKQFAEKGLLMLRDVSQSSSSAINAINAIFVANAKPGVEYRLCILCGFIASYPFRLSIRTSEGKEYLKDWYGYTAENLPPNKFMFSNTKKDGGEEIFCVDIDWSQVPEGIVLNNLYEASYLKLSTTYVNSFFVQEFIQNGLENLAEQKEVEQYFNTTFDDELERYGGSNIFAWGFPVGERRSVSMIRFPFVLGSNSNVRIIFKSDDYFGSVLYDQVHQAADIIVLNSIINDTDNKQRLWLEVYGETIGFSVFRIKGGAAKYYTQALGYPAMRFNAENAFETKTLPTGGGYMDISVDLFCKDDVWKILPSVLPVDENSPYATKEQLNEAITNFASNLLARGGLTKESTNYATDFTIKYRYRYMPNHSAQTDIQNNVYSEYFDKEVSKILTFKVTNAIINATFGRNIIQRLADLEAQGYFVKSFVYRSERYNSGDVPVMASLALRMRYTKNGVATYYLPTTGYDAIPAKRLISQELVVECPSTWADVLSLNIFDDYSGFQSNYEQKCWVEIANSQLRYVDPTGQDVEVPVMVDPRVIGPGITEEQLDQATQKKLNSGGSSTLATQIRKNLRICCAGSSVTWGSGYLRDSMLQYLIPQLQKQRTDYVGIDDIEVNGNTTKLNSLNDRLYFDGQALKVEGLNSYVKFQVTGDEVTFVQGIERSNEAASKIEVYIDGILVDTISNFNEQPLGHTAKTFNAVQGQKEFPLEMPFTYGHVVKVNGVEQQVTLNKGMSMPSSGWAVARDIQLVNGEYTVQHTLFSPTALSAGDVVTCEFDYGQEIVYSRTTIGKDSAGNLESTYGRGYTPFDPANPGSNAFGSGLDFRYTDERIIHKYTFDEVKTRNVQLKVIGLDYRATDQMSEPYFIFNFATNRILYFMNAGIGGWKSSQFLDANNSTGNVLRTWKQIVDWQPEVIFYESTPNDDWGVGGYKLSTTFANISLAQLQSIRTMPNRQIVFNSGTNDYTYKRWTGKIAELTADYVVISDDTEIVTEPAVGDSVVVGTYYSDNWQQVVRLVRSYDSATKKITFDRPINKRDFVYEDFSDFVGKEIEVRDLAAYTNPTKQLLQKFIDYGNKPLIGLVPNPAPNMLSRDLAAYQALLNSIANEKELADWYVGMPNVLDWQHSQVRSISTTVNASDLVTQSDGTKRLDLTGIAKGNNFMDYQILIGEKDVTNKDAVVYTSYCLGVNPNLSGADLNDTSTRGKQDWGYFYPTLVFLKNAPSSGEITVKATSIIWSGDSCHVNDYSKKLFALAYAKFIE